MIKRWLLLIFIVAPIVYLLSFGLMRDPAQLPSALIGKKLPDLSLETLDGKKISLSSFLGKPVVINFWATWCGPCLSEHPVMMAARQKYADIQFVGIAYQDTKESVQDFLKEHGEAFQVLLDSQSQAAIQFGVGGVPETFFVDAEGIIRDKHLGMLTPEALTNKCQALIGQKRQ